MTSMFHRSWRPGIRLQLTFWYTIVFLAVLLITGAILYTYLKNVLETSLDTPLRIQVAQICAGVVIQQNTLVIYDSDLLGLPPDEKRPPGLRKDYDDYLQTSANLNDRVVRLLDAHGNVLRETSTFHTLNVPRQSITGPLRGKAWLGTVSTTSGLAMRLYSQALIKQGQVVGVVQVGQALSHLHVLLQQAAIIFVIVGTLALLLCAISSYWLSRRAFVPIQHLTQTARSIKGGDIHQRIPIPSAHDEIRHLALTLNEMLDALDQTFTHQRRFVADASHELRTPVAVIRNKASVALLGDCAQEDCVSALQDINAEAGRLGHLISDLLALARGDEGQARFEREPVRMDQLVEAVVANGELLANERGISLAVYAGEPVVIIGDEARLIQVVMNLLDNALRYTNPGGQVVVHVEAIATGASLVVCDTGIGIAEEHLPHIFERFYRADSARRLTGGSSSGLGLSIVEWIVRVHGGTIDVSSQVGKGSCFTVTFPTECLQAKDFDASGDRTTSGGGEAGRGKLRIP